MRTEFLCISVVRVASGPRMKLASCKSALCISVLRVASGRKSALNPRWFSLLTVLRQWFRC